MTEKQKTLYRAFASTIKPEQKMSITKWAKANVKVARSSRSEYADLTQTPWLIEPLEIILSNNQEEIVMLAPTGGGKSTMLEIAITYIVAEKPGPTLVCAQSDPDAYEWMQTGVLPALKSNRIIKGLWPNKKNLVRKDFIQFPHMTFWLGGTNYNNLQSKSVDTVIFDEAWLAKPGLIGEGRRRTHDRFNSKVVMCSQAGWIGDELSNAFDNCYKFEYSFKCRNCGTDVVYDWKDIKFDYEKHENEYIWESVSATYECPHCKEVYLDNAIEKRSMADSGKYIPTNSDNPIKNHIGYHFNALAVWWIPWEKLVVEFLKANEQKKFGQLDQLRQFNQKRLALPWADYTIAEESIIHVGDYKLGETKNWFITIVTVDVQKQDLWYVVRTWDKTGESRLLEANKALTFTDIENIQKKHNIKNKAVFLDSAYRTEEVKEALAKYGWLGLNGRADANFQVNSKGRRYKRLYSMPQRHQTSSGDAVITYYSSCGIKDVLFILKAGHGARWGIPEDISQDYLDQIQSEIKILGPGNKPIYKQVKVNNHFLDVEAMQIVGAMMHYAYPNVLPPED